MDSDIGWKFVCLLPGCGMTVDGIALSCPEHEQAVVEWLESIGEQRYRDAVESGEIEAVRNGNG